MKDKPTFSDSQIEMIRTIVQEELAKPHSTLVVRPTMAGKKLEAERAKISAGVDKAIEEVLD